MDDKEIISLFTLVFLLHIWTFRTHFDRRGYGYQVCIVEDLDNLDDELSAVLQWAIREIRKIQGAARSGQPLVKPRWPLIVLRTPKVGLLPIYSHLADTLN
jgi:xylulose-5-phosphate/fructose-6-phosphate phosphoketolase